jgi:hypothetical protein
MRRQSREKVHEEKCPRHGFPHALAQSQVQTWYQDRRHGLEAGIHQRSSDPDDPQWESATGDDEMPPAGRDDAGRLSLVA